MKNTYHSDIYKFNTPTNSYWEDTSTINLGLKKLTKNVNSEVVVIGGGYTGLSCAINLIENYNLDVILVDAGKLDGEHHLEMVVFVVFRQVNYPYPKWLKFLAKKKQKNFLKIQ